MEKHFSLNFRLSNSDVRVQEKHFINFVRVGVENRIGKIVEAVLAGFQGVSLEIGVV